MKRETRWLCMAGACLAAGLAAGGYFVVADDLLAPVLTAEERSAQAKLWEAAGRAALQAGIVHSKISVPHHEGWNTLAEFKRALDIPGYHTQEERELLEAAESFAAGVGQPIHRGVQGAGAGSFERHATAFFRHALEVDPNNADARQGLVDTANALVVAAEAYRGRPGYYDGPRIAIWLYQQALESDPDNARALAALARMPILLVEMARKAAALHWSYGNGLETLQAAAALAPDHPEVAKAKREIPVLLITSAQRDIDAGRLQYSDGAQARLEDALVLDPANQQARQMLKTVADRIAAIGDLHLARDMIDLAGEPLHYYREALAIDPENARAKRGLLAEPLLHEARRALKNGQIAEGRAVMAKIAAIDPEMPGLITLRELAVQPGN